MPEVQHRVLFGRNIPFWYWLRLRVVSRRACHGVHLVLSGRLRVLLQIVMLNEHAILVSSPHTSLIPRVLAQRCSAAATTGREAAHRFDEYVGHQAEPSQESLHLRTAVFSVDTPLA